MGKFFVLKKWKWGVFVKKWTFPQRRVHYVQYQYFLFHILLTGGAYTGGAHPAYGPELAQSLTIVRYTNPRTHSLTRSLGWPFPTLKYKYIFQIKCTEAILPNSTRKRLWLEITKTLNAVLKINLVCYFCKLRHIFVSYRRREHLNSGLARQTVGLVRQHRGPIKIFFTRVTLC